jgi:hypothetical protein
MIELSFTTMNALIHEPHTFLCKYVHGLETFRTPAQEEGSRSHRIVQDHVSGRAEHPGLAHLPFFPHVEQQDFDPRTKVRMPIDEDFGFIGYVDGLNHQTGQFLEIKTGSRWGRQRFLELAQWKLYAAALPDYREVVFVNCPGSPETWSRASVALFRHRIRPENREFARVFIERAIGIIRHIDSYPLKVRGRSRWCSYIGCPYCEDGAAPPAGATYRAAGIARRSKRG